jgi:endosialidase-like protein
MPAIDPNDLTGPAAGAEGQGGIANALGMTTNTAINGPSSSAYGQQISTLGNNAEQYGTLAQAAQGMQGPTAQNQYAGADRGMVTGSLGDSAQQQANAAALIRNSQNAAGAQIQQGTDAGIAANMALANSSRGGAAARAGAQRQAQENNATMDSGVAAQAAQQGNANALQAQGLAQSATAQQAQTGLAQQAQDSSNALAQANLQQQQTSINNQYAANLYGTQATAQANSLAGLNDFQTQENAANGLQLNEDQANAGALTNAVSGVAGAVAAGLKSDERSKEGIRDHDSLVDDFLGRIDPKSFHYKDPNEAGAGHGMYLGAMAQDIEKTPGVGSTMVRDVGGRKMLDTNATLSGALAGLGRLNERLAALETKRGKR